MTGRDEIEPGLLGAMRAARSAESARATRAALRAFKERSRAHVARTLHRMTRPAHVENDLDDVHQEVLVRFNRTLHRFRAETEGEMVVWVQMATRSVFNSMHRGKRPVPIDPQGGSTPIGPVEPDGPERDTIVSLRRIEQLLMLRLSAGRRPSVQRYLRYVEWDTSPEEELDEVPDDPAELEKARDRIYTDRTRGRRYASEALAGVVGVEEEELVQFAECYRLTYVRRSELDDSEADES